MLTRDKLYIGGRWVEAEGGETAPVINPATEEVIGSAPVASTKDTARAIAAARTAFDDGPWSAMPSQERAGYLRRLADGLDRNRAELAALSTAEAGISSMAAEYLHVQLSIDCALEHADRLLPKFDFMRAVNPHFGRSITGLPQITQGVLLREPIGVASLITPFNGPLLLSVFKLAPALAAGCTVVLKPSPYTPLAVLAIGDLADEAGFPPGVINIVTGDVDSSIEMTTNPNVDMVSFTGSIPIGQKVMLQASQTLKRVVLELGGKSPNIVFADADLDRVAEEVAGNMVFGCGQGCILLTRTLVDEAVHDELVGKVAALLEQVTVGDPTDPAMVMGPVITGNERLRIEGMISAGVDEGAELVFGGGRPAHLDKGYYLNPALFANVDNSMSIAQKEIFGPVGAIIPFKDEADAIRIANGTEYGLNASVFTADVERAYRVATKIKSGRVNINSSTGTHPEAPFGGYKHSGIGREGGAVGMSEFLETKFVSWNAGQA